VGYGLRPNPPYKSCWLAMTKAWLVAIILLLAALPAEATGSAFNFAVMGDAPYNAEEEARFYALLESLNSRQDLAFVVHVGDFKGGLSECADALFVERKQVFDASRHPFIYVPGDNEWSDCWRPSAGGYEPVERLQKLRALFFQGNESLDNALLRSNARAAFQKTPAGTMTAFFSSRSTSRAATTISTRATSTRRATEPISLG
jgi:hypothetical protein